ncbi:hypothetical protein BC832DRAFT_609267 [Gaertneriomyces semiglobifer]|nr:hypothetical protein BC832DRAFT_609267 [Gaertneriomyces semiglobifer]
MGGSTIGRRPGGVGGVSADVPLVVDSNNKITLRLDPTSLKINEDDQLAVKADIPALIPDHAPPLLIDEENAVVTLKLDNEKFRVTPQGALSTAKSFDAPIIETPGNPKIQLKSDDTFFKIKEDGTLTIKNIGARQVLFGSGSDKDDPDNPDGYECSKEFFYGELPLGPISLGAVYSPIYITSGGFNILNVMEFPDNKGGDVQEKRTQHSLQTPLNVVDTEDLYTNEELSLDDDTGMPYTPKALTVIHDDTLVALSANDIEKPPGLSINFHHILDRKTLTYDKAKFQMSINHDWTLHTYDPQPDNDTTKPSKLASFGVQFDTNTMMKQLLSPPAEYPDPDVAGRLAVRTEGLIDKRTLRIKTTQDVSNRPLYLIEVDVKNLIDNQTLNVDTHPDTGEVKIKVDLTKLVDNATLTTATSQDGLHRIIKGNYHGSGGISVDNNTGKISGNYSGGTGISISNGQRSSAAGDLVKEGVAGSLGGLANSVVSWYANNGTIITMGALAACLGLSTAAIAKAYGGSNGADAFVVIVDEDGNARAFYDHDATGDPGSAYEGTELVNYRTLQQEIQKAIDNGGVVVVVMVVFRMMVPSKKGRLKYIEFDVCRTLDGVWYLSHNNMEEYEYPGTTSEQLQKGHLKSGWSHLFDGEPLPTLREAWDALRKYPQVIIFLELKNGDPAALLDECRAIGLTPDRMVFSDFEIDQVTFFKAAGYLTIWTVNNATDVQAQDPTTYDHLCCSHDQLSTMYPVADNLEKHLFLYTLDSPHQWKTYREQYERVVGAYADAPVPVSQWYRSFAPYQWECLDPLNGYVSTKLFYGVAGKPRFARYDWLPKRWAARLSVAGSSDNLSKMYGAVFHNYHLDATIEGRIRLNAVGESTRWFGVLIRMFDTYEVDDQPGNRPPQINILFRANRVVDVYTCFNSEPTKVASATHTLPDPRHLYFRIVRQTISDTVELSVYVGNTRSELVASTRVLLSTFTNVANTPWLSLGHLTLLSNGVHQGYIEYYVPNSPGTVGTGDSTHYMEYTNIETTGSMNVGSKAVNSTMVQMICTNRFKHAGAFTQVRLANDTTKGAFLQYNSSIYTGNGGPNTCMLRNTGGGSLLLQSDNVNGGIAVEPGTGDVNMLGNLKVKGAPIGALALKQSLDWNSNDIINKPTLGALALKETLSYEELTNKPTLNTSIAAPAYAVFKTTDHTIFAEPEVPSATKEMYVLWSDTPVQTSLIQLVTANRNEILIVEPGVYHVDFSGLTGGMTGNAKVWTNYRLKAPSSSVYVEGGQYTQTIPQDGRMEAFLSMLAELGIETTIIFRYSRPPKLLGATLKLLVTTGTVVEDEETAHPMVMDYQDEQQWKMNRQRTHHYDRLYRIRRTFFQLLGHATTKLPPTLESDLKKHIHGSLLISRNIYEVIRKYLKQRKLPHLYPAIPLLISRLGGPRWNVPYHKVQLVLEDAFQLHRTFDYLKKQGSLGRQRFPKVQYVVLMLLHRHTILPPYRIPWARTSIKRKQLSQLLSNMKEQNPVLQWANDKPKTDQTTR